MKITRLSLRILAIPFKVVFKHASAARSVTESVVVIAESASGNKGYGEGCPRSYVTGETLETVVRFFNLHRASLMSIASLESLRSWMEARTSVLDENPAAWCALETALLDLLGRENGQSVEAVLSLPELSGAFSYTAVLGADSFAAFEKQFGHYRAMGFFDFKIKVSGDLNEDKEKMKRLSAWGNTKLRVRLDANNLWNHPREAIDYLQALAVPCFAVEEPLGVGDFSGCRKIGAALNIKIILDESFTRLEHFANIRETPDSWIVNLRVSKMGGLLRSLSVGEKAGRLNIPMIVGAQVGETSILSRAALTVANAFRENLIDQEGAFGTLLLERDLIDRPIQFGEEGILNPDSGLSRMGLGIEITHLDDLSRPATTGSA